MHPMSHDLQQNVAIFYLVQALSKGLQNQKIGD